jgi:two-component system sensor histidine kinase/response regulator
MNPSALLADHLETQTEAIIALWRATVSREGDVPDSESLTYREFQDHIPELLERMAERLRGGGDTEGAAEGRAHGYLRWRQGYDIAQVVRELGHLRAALVRATFAHARDHGFDLDTLERALAVLDEILQDAMAESVAQFQEEAFAEAELAARERERSRTALQDERTVRESEQLRLRALLENLPVGVWFGDAQGGISALNPEAQRLGDGEALLGRALSGETIRQQEIIWTYTGEPRTVLVNAAPIQDAAGAVAGAVAVAEDITERKRVEEHLRRQSGFTGAVTDSIAEGLYAVDRDGRLTFMNPAAERMLGWTEGELAALGKDLHESIHHLRPDGSPYPAEECPLWAAFRAGRVLRGEDHFVRKDRSVFPVSFTMSPIIQEDRLIGAVVTFDDITQRKQLEAELADSEARFRSIAELSPTLIWRAGADGQYEYFNRTWLEFRGRTLEEEAGSGWLEGIHPEDLPGYAATVQQAQASREPFRTTFRLRRHDGAYRAILLQGTPYHDGRGQFLGYLGSCIDITERVELEAALREQRELAEEASRRKTRLLSALSHDARTPLNAVALAAQLLELHFRGEADPEVVDCLRMIRHSVDNVQDLLGDLLNLSRIDAGAVSVQPSTFPLDAALAECLSGIEPQARLKGLACRLDAGPLAGVEVSTDRSKLKQIVSNLLSNALRFTARGHIHVFVERDEDQVRVAVEDTGNGIDPADHQRIFEEFATLENPHRPAGEGSGLGLSICRRLANLLGGEISVQSAPGQGSTFRLILPGSVVVGPGEPSEADLPALPADLAPAAAAPNGHDSILIAEDHLASRQAMARVLKRLGYRTLEASNGRDAIALARCERPLAILMDVSMPVMDGIDATILLRADPATRDLPIFALTGDVSVVTRERISQAGINGFLEKPVTPEALNRALRSLRRA